MNPLAWAQSHPRDAQLGGAGALGVVVLALYRRHKAALAAGSGATAGAGTAAGAANSGAAIAGLSGTPNTYGTDQGNYFQDQLNALQTQLQGQTPAAPTVDTSSPAYYRFADSANPNAVYLVLNGVGKWLTGPQYKALGAPKYTETTTLDPVWAYVAPIQVNAAGTGPVRNGPVASTAPPTPRPTAGTGIMLGGPAPAPRRAMAVQDSAGSAAALTQALGSGPAAPAGRYVVPPGGTLAQASHDVYGDASPASVQQLAANNPHVRLFQRGGQTMAQLYPGQVLKH